MTRTGVRGSACAIARACGRGHLTRRRCGVRVLHHVAACRSETTTKHGHFLTAGPLRLAQRTDIFVAGFGSAMRFLDKNALRGILLKMRRASLARVKWRAPSSCYALSAP